MRSWRDRCSWAITGNTQASGELPQHLTLSTLSELLTILPLNWQLRMPFLKMEVKSCISYCCCIVNWWLSYSVKQKLEWRKEVADQVLVEIIPFIARLYVVNFFEIVLNYGLNLFWSPNFNWNKNRYLIFILWNMAVTWTWEILIAKLWWPGRRKDYVSTWITHWHA